jgi:outer membrane protein assembly factor BamD (BamD/ComL family)
MMYWNGGTLTTMIWKYSQLLVIALLLSCSGESADDLFTRGEEATHRVEEYDKAEDYLVRFLDGYPEDPRADVALQALARILNSQNKNTPAVTRYQELVERFPDSRYAAQSQFMIGYIFDQDGKSDLARIEYQKVIERYPDSDLVDDSEISIENLGKAPELWLFPEDSTSTR